MVHGSIAPGTSLPSPCTPHKSYLCLSNLLRTAILSNAFVARSIHTCSRTHKPQTAYICERAPAGPEENVCARMPYLPRTNFMFQKAPGPALAQNALHRDFFKAFQSGCKLALSETRCPKTGSVRTRIHLSSRSSQSLAPLGCIIMRLEGLNFTPQSFIKFSRASRVAMALCGSVLNAYKLSTHVIRLRERLQSNWIPFALTCSEHLSAHAMTGIRPSSPAPRVPVTTPTVRLLREIFRFSRRSISTGRH